MIVQRRSDLDGDGEEQSIDQTVYTRMYQIPTNATLADASLEVADTLPEDATAVIVASKIEQARRKGGGLGMCKIARVTAIALRMK